MINKFKQGIRDRFWSADLNSWSQVFWYVLIVATGATDKPLTVNIRGILQCILLAWSRKERHPSFMDREPNPLYKEH